MQSNRKSGCFITTVCESDARYAFTITLTILTVLPMLGLLLAPINLIIKASRINSLALLTRFLGRNRNWLDRCFSGK